MKLRNYDFLKPHMLIIANDGTVYELDQKHVNNDWWVKETEYKNNRYVSRGRSFLLSFHDILKCKL